MYPLAYNSACKHHTVVYPSNWPNWSSKSIARRVTISKNSTARFFPSLFPFLFFVLASTCANRANWDTYRERINVMMFSILP